jgi:hypothetical protein
VPDIETNTNGNPSEDATAEVDANSVVASVQDYTYANATFAVSSNWDVRIVFAERRPGSEAPVPRVAVVMPHQQAKAFSQMLSRQIEALEKAFGEIRYSPRESRPAEEKAD